MKQHFITEIKYSSLRIHANKCNKQIAIKSAEISNQQDMNRAEH